MQKTSEVYKKIYHYTNWDGLIGIIQNKSLWATHYKFLNDYSEIVLFKNKLISLILPFAFQTFKDLINQYPHINNIINAKGGLDQVVQHETEVIIDAQYQALRDDIYILSFCGEHKNPHHNIDGLLSQWRGYGTGGGFALVFNTKKFEELLEIETNKFQYTNGSHFSNVIYSDDENKLKEELSDDLAIITDCIKQFFNYTISNNQGEADISKGYAPFVRCISRYKHYGFSEENEVRVVLLPIVLDQKYLKSSEKEGITPKLEKEINFREKNGQHIPYIELFKSLDIDLPIEQIIVGPHKEQKTREATLRVMLRKTNIKITRSDIPYIE